MANADLAQQSGPALHDCRHLNSPGHQIVQEELKIMKVSS